MQSLFHFSHQLRQESNPTSEFVFMAPPAFLNVYFFVHTLLRLVYECADYACGAQNATIECFYTAFPPAV